MKLLTFISLDEIAEYAKLSDAAVNEAKKRLAFEVTKIVHGEELADAVRKQTEDLFEKGGRSDDMATTVVTSGDLASGVSILDLLCQAKLTASKGEAKRLIAQNGINLNDIAVSD